MIEVPIGVDVECTDGPAGKSTHVIMDPITKTITHIVVGDDSPIAAQSRLVPSD
jgi:hypothetical protein